MTVAGRRGDMSEVGIRARQLYKNRAAEGSTTSTVARLELEALQPYAVTEEVHDEDMWSYAAFSTKRTTRNRSRNCWDGVRSCDDRSPALPGAVLPPADSLR